MANHGVSVVLTCLLWLGPVLGVGASPADIDSPAVIVLRGVVESKKASGLPQVVFYVLKLPMPVPASGLALSDNSGDPRKGFRELELVCDYPGYPECEATLKKSVSHPTRVVGQTARPADRAGQLPVIVHVRLITVLQ